MKIEGPKGPSSTGITRRAAEASTPESAVAFRGLVSTGTAENAAPARSAQSIAQLDVLLALQGAEDPTERSARRRLTRRGAEVLTVLETVRLKMLSGTMTVGDMIDVADVVATHRDRVRDPELTALMDEIDLRAQVELAKMRLALDDVA